MSRLHPMLSSGAERLGLDGRLPTREWLGRFALTNGRTAELLARRHSAHGAPVASKADGLMW